MGASELRYKTIIPYIHISRQLKTKRISNSVQTPVLNGVAKFVQPVSCVSDGRFQPKTDSW